uniref:dipeptidyl-peptidase III n=1 Tax=Biomphalaria glabrata TaxID=6526 RepID=A0A2C9KUM4_BIOGL
MADLSQYIIPNSTEVALLDCQKAFEGLSNEERLYAHHLAQASFKGGLIVLFQTSPESPGIFLLLQKLFRAQDPKELSELALLVGFTQEDVDGFLIYAAAFYGNMGNYKSFGDTKFIPNVDESKVEKLIKSSKAYKQDPAGIETLWSAVHKRMFSLEHKELGLGDKGISTYYSANCDEVDAKIAQEFLDAKEISPYNTRLFKNKNPGTGEIEYEVRLASVESSNADLPGYVFGETSFVPKELGRELKFTVTRGDYSPLIAQVVNELKSAEAHAANDCFVAVVNKDMSAKFSNLVNNAERLLAHLPWPVEYEKDKFLRPDFTSLEVLAFGGSGIPAGINIPNYDDIRQNEGFKNVSLGNVLTSGYKDSKVTFLREQDKELYSKYKIQSFEVQVGLHELLGHGSGKLFIEEEPGQFNFDKDAVTHTETKEKVTSWYKSGETWDSKFSTIASTYEECRAESVGIYLCLLSDAHMNARFVILRVLIEAGEDLVKIEKVTGEDGNPDLLVLLDRAKIISVGKPAIGAFLRKLQDKASQESDVEILVVVQSGAKKKKMYAYYSDVNDQDEPKFLSLRSIVMDRKQPRKLFVQHHTYIEDGVVKLQSYEPSPSGLIQSFVDRFPSEDLDQVVSQLWEKEKPFY